MINENSLGQPGSAALPIPGQSGTAFETAKIHPAAVSAAAPPRQNPVNAAHPAAVR